MLCRQEVDGAPVQGKTLLPRSNQFVLIHSKNVQLMVNDVRATIR
jgi:hypothetical protein